MQLNKRERTLLVIVIAIIAVSLNYFLVVPLLRDYRALRSDLHRKSLELVGYRDIVEQRGPQWQAELDALRARLGEETGKQDFTTSADLLQRVEEIGSRAALNFTSRRTLPVVEKDFFRELSVQCTVEGSLESLVKFLVALQTSSGLISVEQIQIYPPRADNPNNLRSDLQVVALAVRN
jgi:Tfp pilus assembly protein PilO